MLKEKRDADAKRQEALALGCELIDSIITLDLKRRGAVQPLYQEARAHCQSALTLNAAVRMQEKIQPNDTVIIATGFPVRPWVNPSIGETDGPLGAVAVATAIAYGLNASPVILTPPSMQRQVAATATAMGMVVMPYEQLHSCKEGARPTLGVTVTSFPIDTQEATERADSILSDWRPSCLLSIEHPGASANGRYYSSVGEDISDAVAKTELLFEAARRQGALTISLLDMPNEIGSGLMPNFASTWSANAATSVVDACVVATTANWAGYGLTTALSLLLGRQDIVPTRAREERGIIAMLCNGAIESLCGATLPEAGVDSIPLPLCGNIIDILAFSAADFEESINRKPF